MLDYVVVQVKRSASKQKRVEERGRASLCLAISQCGVECDNSTTDGGSNGLCRQCKSAFHNSCIGLSQAQKKKVRDELISAGEMMRNGEQRKLRKAGSSRYASLALKA